MPRTSQASPTPFDFRKCVSYDAERKRRFHSQARARLLELAASLGLEGGAYDLRSNQAASPSPAKSPSTVTAFTSR
jgi:hypothetical protein